MMIGQRVLLFTWILTGAIAFGSAEAADKSTSKSAAQPLISLTIDFGDGFQKRFTRINWGDGITVLDVMKKAGKHPRGKLAFTLRGKGATTLLTALDGLKNEGGNGRNWIFRVNGELGERSIGLHRLDAGDAILWRFEKYQ